MTDILSIVVWTLTGVLVTRLYMRHKYIIMRKNQLVETTVWNNEGVEILHWKKGEKEE